ncbi:metallo-beta-lactamase [Lucifera butyrica]|uniref:Metallo-beta-lactamase n=1 Tax=Lucifera butyrica TaxID=1351585 RepID=A0A498RCZ4_9FIRM|nr:MBL fold metallo-hydrolase [Lucifera butyrica]VBB08730.1 metallo-beta-lactamase [Lucifera butyrica]
MRLTFLGAAGMVTGSSYLLEVGEQKILVDCGMFQGSKAITALNRRPFHYDPTALDAVILTHAHIDHSGLLPLLCKSGYKGRIYATKVTAELCSIMLPDSAHIQEFDAEIENRKGKRAGRKFVEPLYTVDDAYACLQHFSPALYNTELQLSPQIKIRFQDAGHILGSSMVEVWATEEDKTVKLVFSGDLGQPDQPILKDPTYIDDADYILTESTYGNRTHEHYDKVEKLAGIVNETIRQGGNVIIPAFAVGRTQALLYYLHQLMKDGKIPDVTVVLDSPLAISATEIFMHNSQEYDKEAHDMLYKDHEDPLKLPHLVITKTAEESKALNSLDRPAIIISASGMADAGRILHHLKHNLWRPESSVVLVGYQAEGSLGRRLLEGVKKVKIMGESISVKAAIHNIDGFSAHADQNQLLDWLAHFKAKPANVFIVHGEHAMSEPFAELVRERLGFSAYIPAYGDAAVITGRTWKAEPSGIKPVDTSSLLLLHEFFDSMESEYGDYKQYVEQLAAADAGKIPEIIRRLNKIRDFVRKNLDNLR